MNGISQSVVRRDHAPKADGRSMYVGDYRLARDGRSILCGMLLRAQKARANIVSVTLPDLPQGYLYVDASDVPGENVVPVVKDDIPVFSRGTVEYIGDAIGMLVGPDPGRVKQLVGQIRVEYEELQPVLDPRKAGECFAMHDFGYGDVRSAFAQADFILDEEMETGYQEHASMESQGIMAEPEPDGGLFVHGSCQCAYSVLQALTRALGCDADKVHMMQDVTGGGFGGKETYPSLLACQTAVAALKANAPVRCVFSHHEDMAYSYKRHPSLSRYRLAVKDGRITGLDVEMIMNGGAYRGLSAEVLERSISSAVCGVYAIPNIHIHGSVVKTNTVPNDAFRGFGGPQAIFAIERMMDLAAARLGVEPLRFREMHLVSQGDRTPTSGIYHDPVPLREMIDEIDAATDYTRKHALYAQPQHGRLRRGIGLSLALHGAGLTGTQEKDVFRPVVRLHKSPDGMVEILAATGEIGQGVRTTFPKIVAQALGIPLEKVFFAHPDTRRVPDSGPTSASRSIMTVGELLRRAALRLKDSWAEGQEQTVEERYVDRDDHIRFDVQTFQGDAFPAFSWSVEVVEVELDTLTGISRILQATGNFDVGTVIDENIVLGQMEGGMLQGISWAMMENMFYDETGKIHNTSFTDYLIPTSLDVPHLQAMLHPQRFDSGPFGAKGAGELPLVGMAPAYISALQQAMGDHREFIRTCPCTAETVLAIISKGGTV